VTTMAMPPMLRWGLSRVPMRKEEKERLAREEFEAKGFVSSIERLLLAVDDSPNGKFAARLAGFIAGRRGAPTTVLPLEANGKSAKAAAKVAGGREPAETVKSSDVVKAAADSARVQEDEDIPAPVTITVRSHDKPSEEAVASEAAKGYDLLFVGIEAMRAKSGGFQKEVARVATAFEGPTALVIGSDSHLEDPQQCPMSILVPVAGTDVSRRAAEIAIAVARSCQCPITALYVANTAAGSKKRGRATREQERAIVKDIVNMADHYDVTVKTVTDSEVAPDKAIMAAAKKGKHDLIIMGVGRRPGDTLFFGDTAAAVMEHAPTSLVLVAS
jgi:nucleotide-binding universal stress UspA family protein